MDKKDFVKEHKRLINTLKTPSHADDKKEAKKQSKELKEYTKKAKDFGKDYATENLSCKDGDKTAQKICERNTSKTNPMKKPKSFAKEFKKSYGYYHHGVKVDAESQKAAEETLNPESLKAFKSMVNDMDQYESQRVPFESGTLVVDKKDNGLYNAFFEDTQGEVQDRFFDKTAETLLKDLFVKGLLREEEIPLPFKGPNTPPVLLKDEDGEERREGPEAYREPYSVRIKCGDFEFELKKSLQNFVKSWKTPQKNELKKAISTWRKHRTDISNDREAVKEILDNWNLYGEDFNQVLFAVQQTKKEG